MIIDPSVIRQVSREKDIDPEKMFAALEEAMSSAARKFYRDKAVVTAGHGRVVDHDRGHQPTAGTASASANSVSPNRCAAVDSAAP